MPRFLHSISWHVLLDTNQKVEHFGVLFLRDEGRCDEINSVNYLPFLLFLSSEMLLLCFSSPESER